ncbi:MAG: hypothetical protein AABM33_00995 [Pseudomonadota bacterium]
MGAGGVRTFVLLAGILLAGCAANPPVAKAPVDEYRVEVEHLRALLAAEVAERKRVTRAATRREEALRRQLDAMKAIERGILEREDRVRSESR